MTVRRVTLRDNDHGSVLHYLVTSKDHKYWGKRCTVCNGAVYTGNIITALMRWGRDEPIMLCGKCVQAMSEQMLPDTSDKQMQKIKEESRLVDWIAAADTPMESL